MARHQKRMRPRAETARKQPMLNQTYVPQFVLSSIVSQALSWVAYLLLQSLACIEHNVFLLSSDVAQSSLAQCHLRQNNTRSLSPRDCTHALHWATTPSVSFSRKLCVILYIDSCAVVLYSYSVAFEPLIPRAQNLWASGRWSRAARTLARLPTA